jgi:hypothetical protein
VIGSGLMFLGALAQGTSQAELRLSG